MANDLGQATEMIKQGLRRAGAPRETAQMPRGNPGGGTYHGKEPTEAEAFIKAGLKAAPSPMMSGPLPNNDARAKQIGDALTRSSEERIAEAVPYEKPTEPTKSAEDFIRDGLRAGRARSEAAAQAKEAAKRKVRRTW